MANRNVGLFVLLTLLQCFLLYLLGMANRNVGLFVLLTFMLYLVHYPLGMANRNVGVFALYEKNRPNRHEGSPLSVGCIPSGARLG